MLTEAQANAADLEAGPEPTPPLGSWRAMYILVMVWQVVMVIGFLVFQRAYG